MVCGRSWRSRPRTRRSRRPDDGGIEPGDAQAALFLELHAVALDELRVDHHDEIRSDPADGHVDDEHAQRHADLRRGQADAGRPVHRLDHVVDEPLQCVVEH